MWSIWITTVTSSCFSFQHPIKRFFQRYFFPSPQQEYEKYLHYMYHEDQLRRVRLLEQRINQAMGTRRDFRGPYFKEYYGSKYLYTYKENLDAQDEIAQYPTN